MQPASFPATLLGEHQLGPWTVSGGPDPAFDDADRQMHHALLTDPNLLTCFRRRFPNHGDAQYDEIVRTLGYVWDCSRDRTANVVGYRSGCCGQTRASALQPSALP